MQRKTTLGKTARVLAVLVVVLMLALPSGSLAAPARSSTLTAPLAAAPDAPQTGTISGVVFRDYNASGDRQTGYAAPSYLDEPGIAGVIITAYDVNGAVAGSTTSGATGAYSFTATGASGFRVEFTLPADGSLNYLQAGAAGPTTVVFVPTGGQTGLNVGFNNPIDYSQINPPLVTARTAFGPRSGLPAFVPGSASEQPNESIIGIGFDQDGNLANTNAHNTYATLAQTGTLYGMIYQRRSKLILAGTYFKSYADTGPIQSSGWLQNVDPMGAIYSVQVLGGTPNPNTNPALVYANLNKIIDPGTGVVIPGNPAGVDPRRSGTINYNTNDCDGPGAGGAPSDGATCWQHDPAAWANVGDIALGDLEEDDEERFVFVVNLADSKLYQLPIDPNPANWPITTLAASPVAIPNTCTNPADAVPGGLGFSDGKLYVGVTCTAESTTRPYSAAELAQLKAEVWRFDPATQTFSAAPVFSAQLAYPRGCIFANNDSANGPKNTGSPLENCQTYLDGSSNTIDNANWLPWPQTWQDHFQNNSGINTPGKPGWDVAGEGNFVQLEYPHPWLSDISFVGRDLVLGFRDINGDRTGAVVRSPNVNPTVGAGNNNFPNSGTPAASWMTTYAYNYSGAGLGDLLRACWNGSGWTLEDNGTCGGVTSPGANNGQGPSTAGTYPGSINSPFTGYGEFYWDDSGPGSRNPSPSAGAGVSAPNYIGHEQTMMGGTYQMAGWPDVAVTIADQFGYGDGGLSRFNNVVDSPFITLQANGNLNTSFGLLTYPTVLSDGNSGTGNEAGLALRHTRLYGVNTSNCQSTNTCWWFGKANGLGDVESLSDSAPLELGNRLWCDTGVSGVGAYNGIQDPGETAAPNGITVRLTCGAQYAEVTTSGGTGSYLFTDAIWDASANAAGIIPRNTTCTISVATTGANGTSLTNTCGGIAATVPNAQGNTSNNPITDIRDSDATVVLTGAAITSAQIQVLTGGPGVNNHGLDFGFAAERDYGDAPDPTYPTLAASNGANHVIVAGIRMGPQIDSEQNGQPNAAATGDDTANLDDEDGVTFSALTAGQPAVASVNMTGLSGTPVCYLNAWIDFNGNGSWLDSGEQIATNVALNGGGVVPVSFTVPGAVTTSPTYARFRCSTTQNLTPTGSAPNGEVEDYRVILEQTANLDYGDAPDPTYPTLSISGGASHVLGAAGPRLGACVDAEANGQPLVGATGDDAALGAPVFGSCTNNDDEDGITIPTLTEGVASNITVVVSNAVCTLNAWIDYNGDGDWNDAGEQIATNAAMAIGSNPLPVTPPAAATQAPTYARFRCSTQTGLGATGAAADGEVEDYSVTINAGSAANDWGDAPDTGAGTGTGNYQTVGTDNGAHHLIVAGVYLGACVDAEVNGQPNAAATGDDTNGGTATGSCAVAGDDEDGVTVPTLLAGQTSLVAVSRTAATACYLNGWIDFNANGSWLDAGEQVATNVLLPSGTTNVAVSVPGGATAGTSYARFRCSTQQNLAPTGVATDGEVEDYQVTIAGTAVDWGDLPDGPYATLSANSGPAHVMSGVAYLGKCVDAETDGQPNAGATGDDANATTPRLGACASGNDDEDGVTFGTLTAGTNGTANIDMSAFNTGAQVCFLNAWIDFNGNGFLTDAGEQVASNVQMIGGAAPNAVTFAIPSVVTASPTGARFRCSTQSNLPPIGQAPNGEVEDYMVTITQQSRDFGDAPDTASGTGVGNYNTTVPDNGPSHLIVSTLRLGATIDPDNGTLQNAAATADDTTNTGATDDEDGVAAVPSVSTASTSVQMNNVSVFNTTGSNATLACWIDFNRDGVFSSAERASTTVPTGGAGTASLTFSGFSTPVAGLSYLRCRIASASGEVANPTGPAATGEIEDYQLTIAAVDYGDAPDTGPGTGTGNYNTVGSDNGPNHVIVSGLNLGNVAPDGDPATLQNAGATSDDATATDDEDGVSTLPQITTGTTAVQMTVRATNNTASAATMVCWIDFNRDGDFADTGEKSTAVTVPASSGSADYTTVNFSGFAAPSFGVTYLRCRIATSASDVANPTGAAASGEVEDYQVSQALAATLASFTGAAQADHVLVSWETVSELNNAGFNLYRSTSANGDLSLLGYLPSPAPGGTQGAAYSYQDFDVAAGQTYWYWLEAVDLSGATALYDPISVVFQVPTAVTVGELTATGTTTVATGWLAAAALLVAGLAAGLAWRRRSAR